MARLPTLLAAQLCPQRVSTCPTFLSRPQDPPTDPHTAPLHHHPHLQTRTVRSNHSTAVSNPRLATFTAPCSVPSPCAPADQDNPLPHFIDPITMSAVVRPAISPYGHVAGLATWKVRPVAAVMLAFSGALACCCCSLEPGWPPERCA